MGNWDYGVSAERKDNHGVITAIKVHAFTSDNSVDSGTEWTKSEGVSAIHDRHAKMCTMLRDSNGKWNIRQHISVVNGSTGEYLRSDANEIEEDNLENLPSF